jgi:hypothetical protein
MEARKSIPLAAGALGAAAIALVGVLIGALVHNGDSGSKGPRESSAAAGAPARIRQAQPGQPGAAPVSVGVQQVRGSFASASARRRARASRAARRRAARAAARKRHRSAQRARKSSAGAAVGEPVASRHVAERRNTAPVRFHAPVHVRRRAPRRRPVRHRAPPTAAPVAAAPVAAAPAPPAARPHPRPHGHHRGGPHWPWWWMRHGHGHAYGHGPHGHGHDHR